MLARLSLEAARSYPRTAGLEDRFLDMTPDLLEGLDVSDLRAAYLRALTPKPVPVVEVGHIHSVRLSVIEAVEELVDELPRVGRITFRELTGSLVERLEIVVRFLAILELYKQGIVDLDQPGTFGTITIQWIGADATEMTDGGWMRGLSAIDAYDG